jgi:hypothetical protein
MVTTAVGLGDDQTVTEAIKVFRGAGGLAAMVVCLLLLIRMQKYGFIGSLGLGFVTVVALGPVVQPWYLLWGFVLLAAGVPAGSIRNAVVTASAALSMLVMPKGGTVDVSAIVQAILSAAAVTATAALFELVPPRSRTARLGPLVPAGATTAPPLPRTPPTIPPRPAA